MTGGNRPRARLARWTLVTCEKATGAVDARDMRKPPASETGAVDARDMARARLARCALLFGPSVLSIFMPGCFQISRANPNRLQLLKRVRSAAKRIIMEYLERGCSH